MEGEIVRVADEWAAAIVANDAEAVGSFMTIDWVIVGGDGWTSRDDFLPLVASGDLTHDRMERVGEARVRFHGDTAILTARVVNSGHYRGQAFAADEWTTDVFVLREERWLCAISHITPASH